MNRVLAEAIDRLFIASTLPHVKPGGRVDLSEASVGEALGLVREMEGEAERFDAPPFLDRAALCRPRPLSFDGMYVRCSEEPFLLPVELPDSAPLAARVFPAKGRVRAGLVLLHGWRQPVLGAIGRFGRYAAARGVASVCLELPQHLGRKERRKPAGPGFVSLRPREMLGVLFHAVFEAEWLRQGMRKSLGVPVGILGASIGGWVGGLHACLFEPDFGLFIAPAADVPWMVEKTDLLEPIRTSVSGEELDLLLDVLRMVSPAYREPLVPGRLIGVVGGKFDLVTPFEMVSAYAAGVSARPVKVFRHGHISTLYFNPGLFPAVWAELDALVREAGE